jgi:sporulation protein YlmC with PRC-barrel domain
VRGFLLIKTISSKHRKVYKEFSYILVMGIDKKPHKEVLNRSVVTKEGKKLGIVKDITFETRSGELMHVVLKDITPYSNQLSLERSNQGEVLIPYNAIIAIGDFVVVSEEDLM